MCRNKSSQRTDVKSHWRLVNRRMSTCELTPLCLRGRVTAGGKKGRFEKQYSCVSFNAQLNLARSQPLSARALNLQNEVLKYKMKQLSLRRIRLRRTRLLLVTCTMQKRSASDEFQIILTNFHGPFEFVLTGVYCISKYHERKLASPASNGGKEYRSNT